MAVTEITRTWANMVDEFKEIDNHPELKYAAKVECRSNALIKYALLFSFAGLTIVTPFAPEIAGLTHLEALWAEAANGQMRVAQTIHQAGIASEKVVESAISG